MNILRKLGEIFSRILFKKIIKINHFFQVRLFISKKKTTPGILWNRIIKK